MVENLGLIHL